MKTRALFWIRKKVFGLEARLLVSRHYFKGCRYAECEFLMQIPECQKLLPKAPGGEEPLPEGTLTL